MFLCRLESRFSVELLFHCWTHNTQQWALTTTEYRGNLLNISVYTEGQTLVTYIGSSLFYISIQISLLSGLICSQRLAGAVRRAPSHSFSLCQPLSKSCSLHIDVYHLDIHKWQGGAGEDGRRCLVSSSILRFSFFLFFSAFQLFLHQVMLLKDRQALLDTKSKRANPMTSNPVHSQSEHFKSSTWSV